MTSTDPTRPIESRVTRRCDTCGQIDDHPHHITARREGSTDGPLEVSQHMDCCGCPVCLATLGAYDASPATPEHVDEPRGLELAGFIIDGGADSATAPLLTQEA